MRRLSANICIFPDFVLCDTGKINIDGIELTIEDFGPTECSDNTTKLLPQVDAVIVSDLVYYSVHPWLAEGRPAFWLSALAKAKSQFAGVRTIYAGHGTAGSGALIDQQASYIGAVRGFVVDALKRGPVMADRSKSYIRQKVVAAFAGCPWR